MCPNPKIDQSVTYQIGDLKITDADGDGRFHVFDRIEGIVNEKYFRYDPSQGPSVGYKSLSDQYDETLAGVNAELAKKYNGLKLEDLGALVPLVFRTKTIDAEDANGPRNLQARINDARVFALGNGILFDEQWAVDTWEAGLQKFFENEVGRMKGASQDLKDVYDRLQEVRAFGGPSLDPKDERRLAQRLLEEGLSKAENASPSEAPWDVSKDLQALQEVAGKHGFPWDEDRAE